jgi:uncharacterized damage-inducible protein DinB
MLSELQSRFDLIEGHKRWFVAHAENLGLEQAGKRVREDEWSLAEVIEHLIIAERNFTPGFEAAKESKSSDPFPAQMKRKVVMFVLSNGIKVPTPNDRVIPKGEDSLDKLLPEWDGLRERMRATLASRNQNELGLVAFNHPRAGDLTFTEALDFLNAHFIYHRKRAIKVLGISN